MESNCSSPKPDSDEEQVHNRVLIRLACHSLVTSTKQNVWIYLSLCTGSIRHFEQHPAGL